MPATIEIKKRQLDTGISNRDLAGTYGCSEQFISMVINGHRRSRNLERHIAERLGAPLRELFPRKSPSQAA